MKKKRSRLPLLATVFLLLPVPSAISAEEPPPWPVLKPAADSAPLPGTQALTLEGDLSHLLVSANDAFLNRRIIAATKARADLWKPGAYDPDTRRARLAKMLGLDRDARPKSVRFEYYSAQKAQKAVAKGLAVYQVRWTAIDGVHGDGLLLEPAGGKDHPVLADVVAIPDAGQTPEEIAGLTRGESDTAPYALQLARAGCRVLVPTLINRGEGAWKMTNREWLHRPAFELGRHLLGYELHKVFAGIDGLLASQTGEKRPVGVIGWGEGGLLALYASALDPRIDAAAVSGYFGPRENLWSEPVEHNIHGLLSVFGDAEIAALIAPRPLTIESGVYPDFAFRGAADGGLELFEDHYPPQKGKPGRFTVPKPGEVATELERLAKITGGGDWQAQSFILTTEQAVGPPTLTAFVESLGLESATAMGGPFAFQKIYADLPGHDSAAERHHRQMAEIERHTQRSLIQSRQDRQTFFKDLKTDKLDAFNHSVEAYRDIFRTEVIGDFAIDRVAPKPRTRKYQEGPKTISYEVVLDVFDGVIAYGILTLPKDLDLSSGEKRPVVVCQHGLEGTPQDLVGEPKYRAYKAFATRLAERGFITFAPQNGYKYFDSFRLQQFKSQSIGKTLFSLIIPQHRQITDWLAAQPFVDAERIAFYGLSYGGKSAMRIPPLVKRYCLSICAGDFDEWVWKNAATDPKALRYSYANKGEYEIFEWNLGGTFNYAEMAALICPRPFMVERGHFDGVAPDEAVAYEFAKVRHLYQAKLGIGERCEIEWFPGPHTINGIGSYDFLHRHLNWPKP